VCNSGCTFSAGTASLSVPGRGEAVAIAVMGQHVERRKASAAPLASVELAKFPNPQ